MKLSGKPRLKVKILSPTNTHYDGMAQAVSAVNKVGPFDILADHANFFSLLSKGDVVVHTGFEEIKFPITQGLVKASSNTITLFIDIEVPKTTKPEEKTAKK
jgi:F0F1-type ATP synthase epsilon subunit